MISRHWKKRSRGVLFTGGTDGGEESYGLNNARVLAESKLDCAIIYAETGIFRSEVQEILGRKKT